MFQEFGVLLSQASSLPFSIYFSLHLHFLFALQVCFLFMCDGTHKNSHSGGVILLSW